MHRSAINEVKLSSGQQLLKGIISLYRYGISPFLGNHCRFHPSCSEYARTAIIRYGVWRGLVMAGKRLLCCHPWHAGGYDPVP